MEEFGYERLEMIGRGSFGRVFKVKRTADGHVLAAKCVTFDGLADAPKESEKVRHMAEKESLLLQQLRHPNIVAFHECFMMSSLPCLSVPDSVCVVMSFCGGGDLHQKIKARADSGDGPFSEVQVLWWLVQCLLALRHMHERHVLHRDLKTSNIFLSRRRGDPALGLLKLGDFGLARTMQDSFEMADSCVGTPAFMSPEMLKHQPYGPGSDLWAMGCCLYQMCALKNSFVGVSMANTMEMIVKGTYPPLQGVCGGLQAGPPFTAGLLEIVDRLLQPDQTRRPPAAELLNLPLLGQPLADYRVTLGKQIRSSGSGSSELPSAASSMSGGGLPGGGGDGGASGTAKWDGDLDVMELLLASVAADDDIAEPRLATPLLLQAATGSLSSFEAELDQQAGRLPAVLGAADGHAGHAGLANGMLDRPGQSLHASQGPPPSATLLGGGPPVGPDSSEAALAASPPPMLVGSSARLQLASRGGSGKLDLDVAEWLITDGHAGAGSRGSSAAGGGGGGLAEELGGRESGWSEAATCGNPEDALRSTFDLDEIERMVSDRADGRDGTLPPRLAAAVAAVDCQSVHSSLTGSENCAAGVGLLLSMQQADEQYCQQQQAAAEPVDPEEESYSEFAELSLGSTMGTSRIGEATDSDLVLLGTQPPTAFAHLNEAQPRSFDRNIVL